MSDYGKRIRVIIISFSGNQMTALTYLDCGLAQMRNIMEGCVEAFGHDHTID